MSQGSSQWANPELSIGASCGTVDAEGKHKCWALKEDSPAHQVWKAIAKPIMLLLQDHNAEMDTKDVDLMIEVFMIGEEGSKTGLFYGLITLYACKQNSNITNFTDLDPQFTFYEPEEDVDFLDNRHDSAAVLSLDSISTISRGRLSGIATYQKAPGSDTFQELWVVRCINGNFFDGDCGSWVVDVETGNLCGVVVFGNPGSEIALQRADSSRTIRTEKGKSSVGQPSVRDPSIRYSLEVDEPEMEEDDYEISKRKSWSQNSIQSTVFDTRSLHSTASSHFSKIPTYLASDTHLSVASNYERFQSSHLPMTGPRRRTGSTVSGGSTPSRHIYRPYSTTSTLQSIDSGYGNPPCNNLYIRNLPAEPDEGDLREFFAKQPGFEGIRMKLNEPECFVQFSDVQSAMEALRRSDDHRFSPEDKWGIMVGFARNGVAPAKTIPSQEEIELEIGIAELLGAETMPSMREAGGRLARLISPKRASMMTLPHIKQVTDKSEMLQEMFAELGIEVTESEKGTSEANDEEDDVSD
ncbi:putative Cell wall integrity protein scw1 [Glarea lozoyensis 74030]|uniref:Putative Cell wall integrity protein scw1 n=1 Tax=Glarea lozoyensis (strain ATCC 74030 / MF5533) TaxID=1104152 RepID=H0ELJ8_GLAL7|nr:putative Cell wall integrity protein scw1 [Glarea lozoyensis 74030]